MISDELDLKINNFLYRFFDICSPRECTICGERLSIDEELICSPCNLHLPRTYFAQTAYNNEMAQRFWGLMPIERAAAWIFYDPKSDATSVILRMKYNNHPEYGEILGSLAAREFQPYHFFDSIDALIPIPLAPNRFKQRGFNQSLEIARGVQKVTQLPILNNVIKRTVFKESQTHKTRSERDKNVEGVFQLYPEANIQGKHILLIDDVVTTGATALSCGKELLKAGNVKISILSIGFTKG